MEMLLLIRGLERIWKLLMVVIKVVLVVGIVGVGNVWFGFFILGLFLSLF